MSDHEFVTDSAATDTPEGVVARRTPGRYARNAVLHRARMTRFGRLLRLLSLDELLQLVNALRGGMSILGPQPEEVALVERYGAEHQFRLKVRPGITGPMLVYGRGELTSSEWLGPRAGVRRAPLTRARLLRPRHDSAARLRPARSPLER